MSTTATMYPTGAHIQQKEITLANGKTYLQRARHRNGCDDCAGNVGGLCDDLPPCKFGFRDAVVFEEIEA